MGSAIPRLVVLGSIRKPAEKAMGNKPVGNTHPMASASTPILQVMPSDTRFKQSYMDSANLDALFR